MPGGKVVSKRIESSAADQLLLLAVIRFNATTTKENPVPDHGHSKPINNSCTTSCSST